ncbi:hypothetical protein [Xylocopilactobacillus apicola]|uniref:hypothetical protein n=1 Tax=Xylocopilactobacillus apicola TaxID=2932184 RepID=UPI0029533B83|nr:hypothetical protein [Xylocopilactobacillus apicola]
MKSVTINTFLTFLILGLSRCIGLELTAKIFMAIIPGIAILILGISWLFMEAFESRKIKKAHQRQLASKQN